MLLTNELVKLYCIGSLIIDQWAERSEHNSSMHEDIHARDYGCLGRLGEYRHC